MSMGMCDIIRQVIRKGVGIPLGIILSPAALLIAIIIFLTIGKSCREGKSEATSFLKFWFTGSTQ